MKKKTVSIVIAAAALTLLAGCGSNTASGAGESASAETEAAAETETEEATKTDEETDPAFTEGGEAESTGTVDLSNADGLLKQVLDKGTLVAGMEGNWAPWSYHDLDTNEVIGYDADTARAIGEKLGVEVQIVEAPWESLFAGLDDGRYDIVINGVEVTDERSEKYDFSEPYAYIHTALVVRKDNEEIKSFDYDMMIFFSPTGVKALKKNFPDFKQGDIAVAAFGPATAKTVEDENLRLDLEAPSKKFPSMTGALKDYLERNNE